MSAETFVLPDLVENQNGWGPTSVPTELEGLPFLPFGTNDKLNRIADWTSSSVYGSRAHARQGDVQSVFSFSGGDDGSFTLVDNQKAQSKYSRNKRYGSQSNTNTRKTYTSTQPTPAPTPNAKTRQQPRTGKRWKNNAYRYMRYVEKRTYDPSVIVKSDWEKVESIDLNALHKVASPAPQGEDIVSVGTVKELDSSYLRLLARNERPLYTQEGSPFFGKTTSDDAVLNKLRSTDAGTVYASDAIIALLMSCTHAVYPWDLVVRRVGSTLIFDKGEGFKLDILSVGENAVEPPPADSDSINSAVALGREATLIDQYFRHQVLNKNNEISITKNDDLVPEDFSIGNSERGYRYRKFPLFEGTDLVVRCDVDGVELGKDGERKYLTINALNEYDPKISGIDWRTKLDNQPGAVFANELKANQCKLTKWCARSLLSGADELILGYVSRQPTNPTKHSILKVQQYEPQEFATQIVANVDNMWGILQAIVHLLMQKPEGKYVLMKEPNEDIILLYKVPSNV